MKWQSDFPSATVNAAQERVAVCGQIDGACVIADRKDGSAVVDLASLSDDPGWIDSRILQELQSDDAIPIEWTAQRPIGMHGFVALRRQFQPADDLLLVVE